MLEVDLHAHSHFSRCGVHSILEMLTRARELGMHGLAITDHGPTLKSSIPSSFFDRLHNPVEGVRLLKGMECNVLEGGAIDFPVEMMRWIDVVLLGIHPNIRAGQDRESYTRLLIAAMERHPWVDIVTHTNDPVYPVDPERIARIASRLGIVVELNNSKTALARSTPQLTENLIRACKKEGCRIALCSDAHTVNEIGSDTAVRPLLESLAFPQELFVNRDAVNAFAFLEERRSSRQSWAGLQPG